MNIKKQLGTTVRYTRKGLNWLFKGKSLISHIVFLIVAYFGLKILIFPAFLTITGLNEVVAVLSGSMHHQPGSIENTFDMWLEFNGFNETDYENWPFIYGLDVGDAVTVILGDINVGDVIVYYYQGQMIIHRTISITELNGVKYYTTKGDANPESMNFEVMVPETRVVGKASMRVPYIGWPRTIMYYLLGF